MPIEQRGKSLSFVSCHHGPPHINETRLEARWPVLAIERACCTSILHRSTQPLQHRERILCRCVLLGWPCTRLVSGTHHHYRNTYSASRAPGRNHRNEATAGWLYSARCLLCAHRCFLVSVHL